MSMHFHAVCLCYISCFILSPVWQSCPRYLSSLLVLAAPLGSPVLAAWSWRSYPGSLVPAVPFCLSSFACPVCLSCSACPVLPVLFCLSSPAFPVLPVLFCLSCSACPVLRVLFCLPCPAYPFLPALSWHFILHQVYCRFW
jgi:hypothetical protein